MKPWNTPNLHRIKQMLTKEFNDFGIQMDFSNLAPEAHANVFMRYLRSHGHYFCRFVSPIGDNRLTYAVRVAKTETNGNSCMVLFSYNNEPLVSIDVCYSEAISGWSFQREPLVAVYSSRNVKQPVEYFNWRFTVEYFVRQVLHQLFYDVLDNLNEEIYA